MPRMSMRMCLIGVLVLVNGCPRREAPSISNAPIPVLVRPVQDASDIRGARYSGTIEPATRVEVAFKVGGYVRELLQVKGQDGKLRKVQEGDFVSAGTALAVVRQSEYQEKVAGANAQLAQAMATQKQAQ